MATLQKYAMGSALTLLSTELNSLATSATLAAGAVSSVGGTSGLFNNTASGGSLDGYAFGRYELVLAAPAGTLSVNTAAHVWFLGSVDGTNYEDGSASVIPARRPDLILPVRAVSTAQRIAVVAPLFPANCFVVVSQNTGQAWGATLNTLKVQPITWQGV